MLIKNGSFFIEYLPKISIDLLQGFSDENYSVHCIGFIYLYQKVVKMLRSGNYSDEYVKLQLNSLSNRWAFWLAKNAHRFDSMSEDIKMVSIKTNQQLLLKFWLYLDITI